MKPYKVRYTRKDTDMIIVAWVLATDHKDAKKKILEKDSYVTGFLSSHYRAYGCAWLRFHEDITTDKAMRDDQ